ncbi:MAG: MFS transporter, partial [Chloroflexota bacterium]
RWTMIIADTAQVILTFFIAWFLFTGRLAPWQVYVISVFGAVIGSFHGAASHASLTMMVPEAHLARAAGLNGLSRSISGLLAPTLAGILVVTIGLEGIVFIDLGTFLVALATYFVIRIPRPPASPEATAIKGSLWRETLFGWRYVFDRPVLLSVTAIGASLNFFGGIASTLTLPMVLAMADADAGGLVLTAGAVGGFVSGSLMGAWGGPKNQVKGMVAFLILGGLGLIIAGWYPLILAVIAGRFIYSFAMSLSGAMMTAIEIRQTSPDVQGRVFGAAGTVHLFFEAISYPTAGFLADRIFEPLMIEGGGLVPLLGSAMGTGSGRGMGLISVLMGICVLGIAVTAYWLPALREFGQTNLVRTRFIRETT